MKEGSKYYPLFQYLNQHPHGELTLTLASIATLLGTPLPASAHTQRGWWSNRSRGAVQANAWMQAGYHVETVDLKKQQITFRKPTLVYHVHHREGELLWNSELIKALRHHMGLTQAAFARELGVRQPTISEWETGAYEPKRSTSKLLSFVAERAKFRYDIAHQPQSATTTEQTNHE